jgi:PhnB protein
MTIRKTRPGFHTVTPYLVVRGLEAVLEFMRRSLDATETRAPSRGPDGRIIHVEMQIGDSRLMLGEASEAYPPMPAMLVVYVADVDATHARALAAGGLELRAPTDEDHGDRTSGVRDSGDNQWWISSHIEEVSDAEIERRRAARGHG